MSVCSGIGGGIGGKLGTWGAGLGSALGLGAAVDLGVRAYTGYGLLDTLSVSYIECPDGSFASAIEWYGSGLKCPQKPEPIAAQMQPQTSGKDVGENYANEIEALGGSVFPYFGAHAFASIKDVLNNKDTGYTPGHFSNANYPESISVDLVGNVVRLGLTDTGDGVAGAGMFYAAKVFLDGRPDLENFLFRNGGWGGYGGRLAPSGLTYRDIRQRTANNTLGYSTKGTNLLGVRASLPSLPFAPPVASIPPSPAFSPRSPSPPDECQMSCPCISPQEIEKIIRKVIGLAPFAPEKLVREMGAKIYAAPGPSIVPVVPVSLVDAIAGLIATNYMRAGFGRYPVVMPGSIIAGDNPLADAAPTNVIENQAEWIEWIIKQQDAVQGEWPIDIEIKDGIKRDPLKFENIAEAFAELTGLVVQTAADADTAVNAACTAATIAQKGLNAATIAQKNVECLIQFFGVRTGFKSIFVQSSITPADPDDKNFNIKKFLTPSGQNLAVLTDQDDFDLQAVLDRILRNTEINRAAVARNVDKDGIPGDFARNQRKYDSAEARRETEKEMEKLETSIKQQNPQIQLKIKVNSPASDLIAGDNFVIKRPKKEASNE